MDGGKSLNLIKWIAVIFVAVFILAQIYNALIAPVTTDTVYSFSSYSGCEAAGYIIRNETILNCPFDGVLSYEVANGGRVAKNGTVATVYADSSYAERQSKIERLDDRIATLEKLQTYNDLNAADLGAITRNIRTELLKVSDAVQNGKVKHTESYDSLLEYINRKQIVTGEISGFSGLIADLKAQRESLSSALPEAGGKLTSPESGYVIYSVDGYESILKVDDISSLTYDKLGAITPDDSAKEGAVCKIVNDHEWYIAAAIPFSDSLKLREGAKVTLKTELLSIPELPVTVNNINKLSSGENAVVVFSCKMMNTELASSRMLNITVVFDEYKGLKVDNRAIRVVDGKKGVYIITASQAKFIPINLLWSGDNYSIVEQQASDQKVLRIYDEIIVRGRNLYDGKIIS